MGVCSGPVQLWRDKVGVDCGLHELLGPKLGGCVGFTPALCAQLGVPAPIDAVRWGEVQPAGQGEPTVGGQSWGSRESQNVFEG